MARFVIGNTKISGIPAIVRDMSPAHYIEKTVDVNGKLVSGSTIIDLNGITDLNDYVLYGQYFYAQLPANTSIDMSSLTQISGGAACCRMFYHCPGITSVDLSGLTTIRGANAFDSTFVSCSGLTSIDFSALTTISANAVFNDAFSLCTNLTTAKFNKLNVISQRLVSSIWNMFGGCSKLESVEFGGLTASTFSSAQNQLQNLFNGTTGQSAPNGCTVHFPSNFDPSDQSHTFDASTLTGYPTFGGSASYIHVAFDLPATE